MAHVHIAMHSAPIKVVHGYELDAKEARDLAKTIARSAPKDIAALPGVPVRRVNTLPAAALVFERVLKCLKPERVVFSALGLREGWLFSQLSLEGALPRLRHVDVELLHLHPAEMGRKPWLLAPVQVGIAANRKPLFAELARLALKPRSPRCFS